MASVENTDNSSSKGARGMRIGWEADTRAEDGQTNKHVLLLVGSVQVPCEGRAARLTLKASSFFCRYCEFVLL